MARKLVLQDFFPYLLNRAGARMAASFAKDIEPHGVTLPMWRVMTELWHRGDFRLGELAERTNIDISTLSRLLVSMQRKGLIARRRSGADGRALSLTLTPHGLDFCERLAPNALYYESLAMRGLSDADIKRLKKLLTRVFENLEEAVVQQKDKEEEEKKPRARKRAAS